ncbi:Ribonuclease H [Abeliophyllum distichum]|uniref:Ribonuclease H n=1 Tax=Abeliophyllum distichum TaxID=126358 RepID=A0ABD1Q9X2_9LAMI
MICIDFSDLNQACPKDSFSLPRIDQLLDATASHKLLSFMDAYSGYNQIPMLAGDEGHTSFIMDRGIYCYEMMSFSLKNAGATYQRLVNRMFVGQIVLRNYRMKLNPLRCAFIVASGKFLGYMVNQRGIEANPKKIRALIEMRSSSSPKEVQSLTGRLAALNWFISKVTDRCQPFFQTIKAGKREEGPVQLSVYYVRKAFQDVGTSQFDISYMPRPSIKGQVLVDFVAEFAHIPEGSLEARPEEVPTWKLYVDGSSSEAGAGAEILLSALTATISTARFA